MLKKMLFLFILACGLFYVYQKNQVEEPAESERPRVVDDSGLEALKQALPPVIFEKDIQPVIEKNKEGGLTPAQIDALVDKLDTIAEALGGKTASAVQEALKTTVPEIFPRKNLMERTVDVAGSLAEDAADTLKDQAPALKHMAMELLQGLTTLFSRLLGAAAELVSN